ncbi:MAG TPA: hypothetical protein PK536_12455, partial [Ignavibacteria bacterium]|nr:hypothetical protein [Ignavibacteria bacterium]
FEIKYILRTNTSSMLYYCIRIVKKVINFLFGILISIICKDSGFGKITHCEKYRKSLVKIYIQNPGHVKVKKESH